MIDIDGNRVKLSLIILELVQAEPIVLNAVPEAGIARLDGHAVTGCAFLHFRGDAADRQFHCIFIKRQRRQIDLTIILRGYGDGVAVLPFDNFVEALFFIVFRENSAHGGHQLVGACVEGILADILLFVIVPIPRPVGIPLVAVTPVEEQALILPSCNKLDITWRVRRDLSFFFIAIDGQPYTVIGRLDDHEGKLFIASLVARGIGGHPEGVRLANHELIPVDTGFLFPTDGFPAPFIITPAQPDIQVFRQRMACVILDGRSHSEVVIPAILRFHEYGRRVNLRLCQLSVGFEYNLHAGLGTHPFFLNPIPATGGEGVLLRFIPGIVKITIAAVPPVLPRVPVVILEDADALLSAGNDGLDLKTLVDGHLDHAVYRFQALALNDDVDHRGLILEFIHREIQFGIVFMPKPVGVLAIPAVFTGFFSQLHPQAQAIPAAVQGHRIQRVGIGAEIFILVMEHFAVVDLADLKPVDVNQVGQLFSNGRVHGGYGDLQLLTAVEFGFCNHRHWRDQTAALHGVECHFNRVAVDRFVAIVGANHDGLHTGPLDGIFEGDGIVFPVAALVIVQEVVLVLAPPPVAFPVILKAVGPALQPGDIEGHGYADVSRVVVLCYCVLILNQAEAKLVLARGHGDKILLGARAVPAPRGGVHHDHAVLASGVGQDALKVFAVLRQRHTDGEGITRFIVADMTRQAIGNQLSRLVLHMDVLVVEVLPMVFLVILLDAVDDQLQVIIRGVFDRLEGEAVITRPLPVAFLGRLIQGHGAWGVDGDFIKILVVICHDPDGHDGPLLQPLPTLLVFIPDAQRIVVFSSIAVVPPPGEAVPAPPFVAGIVLVHFVLPLIQTDVILPGNEAGDGIIAAGGHVVGVGTYFFNVRAGDRKIAFRIVGHGEVIDRVLVFAFIIPETRFRMYHQLDAIVIGFKTGGGNLTGPPL